MKATLNTVLVAITLSTQTVTGQIVPISQNRTIESSARGEGNVDGSFIPAEGFGRFADSLHSSLTFANGNSAWSAAEQVSFIGTRRLAGRGSADAHAAPPPTGASQGNGLTLFDVVFELPETTPVRLDWTITSSHAADSMADIALIGPAGLILLHRVGEFSNEGVLFDSGVFEQDLDPGVYTLEAFCAADSYSFNGVGGEHTGASWRFALTVPAPPTVLSLSLAALPLAIRRRRSC